MAVLGYLPKLKMDLELEFCAHLLYEKYLNTLLILKKSMDKVSLSYLFPSQDIKQNVLLLSSYLDN